jgi:hypothetical protein
VLLDLLEGAGRLAGGGFHRLEEVLCDEGVD